MAAGLAAVFAGAFAAGLAAALAGAFAAGLAAGFAAALAAALDAGAAALAGALAADFAAVGLAAALAGAFAAGLAAALAGALDDADLLDVAIVMPAGVFTIVAILSDHSFSFHTKVAFATFAIQRYFLIAFLATRSSCSYCNA